METSTLQRFRENIDRQRQNLLEWLTKTPSEKKDIRLGTADQKTVHDRLVTLDNAIAKAEHGTLGLCDVCHEHVETDRLEMDFTACVCIDHYSVEQKRRLEQDLELSHKVQKALLPRNPPSIPGLRVAAFIQPAEVVGGDYFDFFRFKDGTYGFAVADVMGKGLSASMLVASLQASLRILVPENVSPSDVVQRVNQLFCHNIHLVRFISIFLGRYDPSTKILEYCNAGHNPPLHRSVSNGKTVVGSLKPTGPAIGLTECVTFGKAQLELRANDTLLLYTDGVTEARNVQAEEYGPERLMHWLGGNASNEPGRLIDELRRTLHQYTGTKAFQDDLTLVAVRRFE